MQKAEHVINHIDRKPGAQSRGLTAEAVVKKDRVRREARAEAFMGEATAHASLLEVSARGPAVGAHAHYGLGGVGTGVNVELGSVAVKTGFGGIEVGPNLNTGVRLGLDNAMVRVLGLGLSISFTGFAIMTPLGSLKIGGDDE